MSNADQSPAKQSRVQSVKVPGRISAAEDGGPVDSDGQDADTLTLSRADLEAAIARGVAQAMASRPAAAPASVGPEDGLPDQADIDPAKIKAMVLTKQGYVVPEKYGASAKAPQL